MNAWKNKIGHGPSAGCAAAMLFQHVPKTTRNRCAKRRENQAN